MKTPIQQPVTEDDIANYLANTPEFFARHAELLSNIQINSPHGNRAVSLQERQAEMLRDKIRMLELRLIEMIRNGNENVLIANRLHQWTCRLLQQSQPEHLPDEIAQQIGERFQVPQVAIKVWDVASAYATADFALGVSADARSFASSLSAPFCGVNAGLEPARWLPDPSQAVSMALLPLRTGPVNSLEPAFGLLVLASPDVQRFQGGMGTDFLERIAELASAALACLRWEGRS